MPVKCLKNYQQIDIVNRFVLADDSIDNLARVYNKSRRTIIRVLEDHGVDPKIKRRQRKPKPKLVIPQPARIPAVLPLPYRLGVFFGRLFQRFKGSRNAQT